MREEKTQKTVYSACETEGSFIRLAQVNNAQIKSMLKIASLDLSSAKEWAKNAKKESGQWNAIFRLHYDFLHELTEAFIQLDGMKARTHECVFAFLCEKYPEFDFSWQFFENVRTKRNRSLYYGEQVTYERWKEVEFQMNLYINTLIKAIDKKLK